MIGSETLPLWATIHSQQRPCLGQSVLGQEQYVLMWPLTGQSVFPFSILNLQFMGFGRTTINRGEMKWEILFLCPYVPPSDFLRSYAAVNGFAHSRNTSFNTLRIFATL
jgi:hypothetical protein